MLKPDRNSFNLFGRKSGVFTPSKGVCVTFIGHAGDTGRPAAFHQRPFEAYNAGGRLLTDMLQPATVAFAIPLYKYFPVLKNTRLRSLSTWL